MANAFTSLYRLIKPEVNADADQWGGHTNTDWDSVDKILGAITTTGSANAYVLTSGQSLTAYASGQSFLIKPNFTNSGAATLNVDGIGAKAITKNGTTALASGDLVSGTIYRVSYDGTQFQVLGPLSGVYQTLDATLTALAALSWGSNRQNIVFTAADTVSLVQEGTSAQVFLGPNGTAGAPTFAFSGTPTTGMYITGGGTLAFTVGGTLAAGFLTSRQFGMVSLASVSTPELLPNSADANSGLRWVSADVIALTVGGVDLVQVNSAGILVGGTVAANAVTGNTITGPPAAGAETTGTMTAGSANDHIIMTGNMTQAASGVFAARDSIQLDPGTSARTVTRGTSMAMYVNGVDSASATIAANTLAVLYYRSTGVSILSGSGVS